jgi:hypothetical protein
VHIYRSVSTLINRLDAQENLTFVREGLGKHFVVALKSNRTLALTLEDKSKAALPGSTCWPGRCIFWLYMNTHSQRVRTQGNHVFLSIYAAGLHARF